MRRPTNRPTNRHGLTLVELVIAMGLLALLMISVFDLMRGFLALWDKAENRRAIVEESSGVAELLATDLSALENGPRGDLWCDWGFFDTDGDGVQETIWPRLRMVRHVSRPEILRLQARDEVKREGEGLIEVCWAVVPAYRGKEQPDLRAEGVILRGERIIDRRVQELSFLDEAFFGASGEPAPGRLNEVSGSLLWLGVEFATQTSLLDDGWHLGGALADVAASWDAWNKKRPAADRHAWNEPGAGMPSARGRALLPRRVKLELEVVRPRARLRRTRLSTTVTAEETALPVTDGRRVPQTLGAFVKIDAEWMRITSLSPSRVGVVRGERGTRPTSHAMGAMVHHGETFRREVPVPTYQDDWNL